MPSGGCGRCAPGPGDSRPGQWYERYGDEIPGPSAGAARASGPLCEEEVGTRGPQVRLVPGETSVRDLAGRTSSDATPGDSDPASTRAPDDGEPSGSVLAGWYQVRKPPVSPSYSSVLVCVTGPVCSPCGRTLLAGRARDHSSTC
jgi:hypothetical protein